MKQKICTKCPEIKDMTEFHRNKHNSDGRASRCKACLKAYYQANKERDLAGSRKYYQEHGKALRKLPKKEKQFSVNDEAYKKEQEKFWNEECYFVKRAAWQAREYDHVEQAKRRKKYYEAHKNKIANRNRDFYRRNRDVLLEKAQEKRDKQSKKERDVFNKNHRENQRINRENMSDEEWEAASEVWRERYRLEKGGEVRTYRRNKRRKK